MQYHNSVCLRVYGRRALFSDPLTRLGGEKYSYPVPTYQAVKGILESVYWKPTFQWVVDQVRVLHPIRTQSKSVRPLDYHGGNTLSFYTYLTDVEYQVKAHFEWNENRPDLTPDRNEHKHFQIARRMVERGGRRDVFLGTRECQAYVEPGGFPDGPGAYDDTDEVSFGLMFHGFSYPDETGRDLLQARLWHAVMHRGVLTFPRPEECLYIRDLHPQTAKPFMPGVNFDFCGSLAEEEGL
ncbi:MAG: type I-C CRISPR-associated protein Cas5 [Clostridiales bacterium]|nr:type I-C CRISPR-associated protein Cas5 [Clostridiales bacterium]